MDDSRPWCAVCRWLVNKIDNQCFSLWKWLNIFLSFLYGPVWTNWQWRLDFLLRLLRNKSPSRTHGRLSTLPGLWMFLEMILTGHHDHVYCWRKLNMCKFMLLNCLTRQLWLYMPVDCYLTEFSFSTFYARMTSSSYVRTQNSLSITTILLSSYHRFRSRACLFGYGSW